MTEKLSKNDLSKLPFRDNNLELEKRVEDLLNRLTLDEKFKLSSGRRLFQTKPIKRLGIKPYKMSDGPLGLGALGSWFKKTTYFSSGIGKCATWNPELSEQFGKALGEEVRSIKYHMILAPGINIQRSPLCGRNFEYQTEDPYLNSITTVAIVKGVQSQKIAVCIKHYAANNQETKRMTVSSEVSERALEEIYFPAFKAAVQDADAWSIMGCYNKVNGIYGCENKYLLTETLRGWGFRGFVCSDWWATKHIKTTEGCVNGGLSLEMPYGMRYKKRRLKKALREGKFKEETYNENLRRLLRVMFLTGLFDENIPKGSRNTPEHHAIARKIAEEGIVLLKNEGNLLPLNMGDLKKIAVIGPNVNKKHSPGGGSSMIRSFYEITPLKGIKEKCKGKVEIIKSPSDANAAIIFAGLNHKRGNDCEGKDRKKLELPEKQIELIKKTVQENPHTIVVLISGSPVAMDWIDKVPVVIEAWYPGMEGGRVIIDILFGDVNPSGKLPITFPKKLTDSSAHKSRKTFPGNSKVFYEEGIFVGYRHFDKNNIEPLFPFGFGLSYTTFTYENLQISNNRISEKDKISISCDIINSGNRAGAEVVQLYVQNVKSNAERPVKELKGFKKIKLQQGEKGMVIFELDKKDLSFYDEKDHNWKAEKGIFKILVGSSSRDIRLQDQIEYIG